MVKEYSPPATLRIFAEVGQSTASPAPVVELASGA
jgi:hypothetical protein